MSAYNAFCPRVPVEKFCVNLVSDAEYPKLSLEVSFLARWQEVSHPHPAPTDELERNWEGIGFPSSPGPAPMSLFQLPEPHCFISGVPNLVLDVGCCRVSLPQLSRSCD